MSAPTLAFYAATQQGLYITRSGNQYVPAANGIITGVPATGTDIIDLINAGCQPLPNFGGASAPLKGEGKLYRVVGNPVSQPGATAVDSVLAAYSIPAGSFDQAGRGLIIIAAGSFANNTNSKQCKIIFNPSTAVVGATVGTGGTVVANTGAYTTTGACGWSMLGTVFKYGVQGSNTQVCQCESVRIAATTPDIGVPLFSTATESGAILIAVTGNAATATTDISLTLIDIQGQN